MKAWETVSVELTAGSQQRMSDESFRNISKLALHRKSCLVPLDLPASKDGPVRTVHAHWLSWDSKDAEGEDDLQVFEPFGASPSHRAPAVRKGGGWGMPAVSWALVTYLEESSVDALLAAQAKSPLLAGKAEQVPLSCQRVGIEKATTSTGAWRRWPRQYWSTGQLSY